MLWVDKHRPTSLEKLDYHKELSQRLIRMTADSDFPHLLFSGPSGSGKKTRIMALLRQVYGPGVEKLRIEHRSFKAGASGSTNVEINVLTSNYHLELNPSDAGIHDRFIVQDMIKEIASSQQLDSQSQKSFKVIILNEVDRLTKAAQNSLRRTMEKYVSTCRLILCCNSTSKIIEPLRSRCLAIRVAAPTHEEIIDVLQHVSKKENVQLPQELAERISQTSGRNLRRALLMLEATKVANYPFTAGQPIQTPDWEHCIADVAKSIIEEQSPARLLVVRGKLYELLTHCIPPEVIVATLAKELMANMDSELKYEVAQVAAFYEHRLQQGQKAIFHLEAFVARVMSTYKNYLVQSLGF